MKISDYPVIKILILFLIGFLFAYHIRIEVSILIISVIILLIFNLLSLRFFPSVSSILISINIILVGQLIFSASYYEEEKELKLIDKIKGQKVLIYGRVQKVDYFDQDKIQYALNCYGIVIRNKFVTINQKFLVSLNLKNNSLPLRFFEKIIFPGNQIKVSGRIETPLEGRFIGDFNQKFYLKSKDINYIVYSDIFDELNLIHENNSIINLSRQLHFLRQKIKTQIEQNFDSLSSAYIKGLFLAERSDIPEEIKTDFVHSGVIHVLAVSGLHTGYIVLILLAFTGRINKWLKLIFVIMGLYVFAHLANLSPSVIRASIMSVVLLISILSERKNYILNSIAMAALIILIFNPLDIFNQGFQLSFFAVLSIAMIYPALVKAFGFSNLFGIKKYLIDLLLISLAVSLGTFPFVASYYQKFSFVALIANLIIIPLTGFLLGGIILNLVVINFTPFIASIYKLALVELININFSLVKFFANLPFAYISIKTFSLFNGIVYIFLIASIIWIIYRSFKPHLKFVFISLLIFNYFLHFQTLSNRILDINKNYLCLIKLNNSFSIFIGNKEDNLFKLFPKSTDLRLVRNDLRIIEKILWSMDYDKIHYASFSTPAIWLKNDFKKLLNLQHVNRIGNSLWFIGDEVKNFETYFTSKSSSKKYFYINNSDIEIYFFNDWVFILSQENFHEIANHFNRIKVKFIYLKPEMDSLVVKNFGKSYQVTPIKFENSLMKLFEIKNEELKEIQWK